MKKILLTIAIVSFSFIAKAQDKINWLSLNEALKLQKENPKKIMMDVYTNWCGPCKMLDKHTFQNKDVAAYVNEHYYAVKFNAEGNETINYNDKVFENPNYKKSKANTRNSAHELTNFMGFNAYPTIAFFSELGDPILPLRGYYKPKQLEFYLKLLAENQHKKLKTKQELEDYQKAFKPQFKS
jgi:thioredoxin-related protein